MHGILRMIGTTDLVNVYINSELENGPVEIVDLSNEMVIFLW
jgi:hypothetical protein